MINKETYKRLTERRGGLVIDNCGNCPNVNNLQGCTDKNCYEIMKNRLAELEDKILNGTLVEFNKPFYSNQFNAWCIYLKDGDYITSLCLTKEQAEARLKELQEEQECR